MDYNSKFVEYNEVEGSTTLAEMIRGIPNSYYDQFSITLKFINGIPNTPIQLTDHNNIKTIISPNPRNNGKYINKFVIRVIFDLTESNANEINSSAFNLGGIGNNTENKSMAETIYEGASAELKSKVAGNRNSVVYVDLVIDRMDLVGNGGRLYHNRSGYVLSTIVSDPCLHPYSKEYINWKILQDNQKGISNDNGYFVIEIIDNNGIYSDRFMNLSGEIIKVKPKRDGARANGVYVTSKTPFINNAMPEESQLVFYPYEVAFEKFGLYRNYEEAKYAKEEEVLAHKEYISKLEKETATIKAETNKEASEAAFKTQLEKNKTDITKNVGEMIKNVVTIIGWGIAVIGALYKAFKFVDKINTAT